MFIYSTTTKRVDVLKNDGEFSGYYAELSVKTNRNTLEKYLLLDSKQIGGVDYITMELNEENYNLMERWFNEYVNEFKEYFEIDGNICRKMKFSDGIERIKREVNEDDGKIHIKVVDMIKA